MKKEDIKADLKDRTACIRSEYLNKPIGKNNVALADIYLVNGITFCVGATSKGGRKSPIPKPLPKASGGQFEPIVDPRTQRIMDTDAEYKVLSAIAQILDTYYINAAKGELYLYTEFQPCESCNYVLQQFNTQFPNIETQIFWDYPYP